MKSFFVFYQIKETSHSIIFFIELLSYFIFSYTTCTFLTCSPYFCLFIVL